MAHHCYYTWRDEEFEIGNICPAPKALRKEIKVGDMVEAIFIFDHSKTQRACVRITKANTKRLMGKVERNVYDQQSACMEGWSGHASWHCEACDFDLCETCYRKGKIKHAHPLTKTKVPEHRWAYCDGDSCVKLKHGTKVSLLRSGVKCLLAFESKNAKRIYQKALK